MNKVIDVHKYDTETAKLLGEAEWERGSNFDEVVERLYRTKSGFFFLYGYGGANTRYSVQCGSNNWTGGSMIIPMDIDAAKEWAEDNMSADEYEEAFGEVSEETCQISATLPVSVKEKLEELKKKSGETAAELLARLIKEA